MARWTLLTLLTLTLLPRPAGAKIAGPDAYGYWVTDANEQFGQGPSYNPLVPDTIDVVWPLDDTSHQVSIGWDFTFYGVDYDQLWLSSNGLVSFDAAHSDPANTCAGVDPGTLIMALWDDLNPSATGYVSYGTSGISPNRIFVITWLAMPRSPNVGNATFQIQLHESDLAV